ncbi:MAG: hypothetical protein SVV80_08890 [Planctomycetota bacterium]|nr:hypothetical protein [Planctomycetota bacterium]
MMTTLRLTGLTLAAGTVLWLTGCNNSPGKMETTSGGYREVAPPIELIAQANPPIHDVPVPIGFKLDENRSRNFTAAGARYVDHLYKGSADKWVTARFYKRQMPTNRWTFVTDIFAQGDIRLDFERETERCQIIIGKGSLFHPTYIKVQLWTTGRIIAPEEKTGGKTTTK